MVFYIEDRAEKRHITHAFGTNCQGTKAQTSLRCIQSMGTWYQVLGTRWIQNPWVFATIWPVSVACLPQYAEKHLLFKSATSLTLKTLVAREKSCDVPSLSFCMEARHSVVRMMRLATSLPPQLALRHHCQSLLNLHDLHKSNLTFRCKLRQCPMSCRVLHLLPHSTKFLPRPN